MLELFNLVLLSDIHFGFPRSRSDPVGSGIFIAPSFLLDLCRFMALRADAAAMEILMATKHNLSGGDTFFVGRAYDAPVYGANASKGVPVCFLTRSSLGSPAVADDDLLIDDATSGNMPNASTKTYTPANNGVAPCNNASIPAAATIVTSTGASVSVWTLDAPRNLVAVTSTAAYDTVITITGYDIYKVKMVETLTIAQGQSTTGGVGAKAFKYVSSIAIYSANDVTTDTLKIGTGEVLGLPYLLTGTGDFVQASLNGVFEGTRPTVVKGDATTPSAVTGDVRGTIDLSSTLNGTEVVAYFHVIDPNTPAGLRGAAQFGG